jgi:hypothetical protein
MPKKSEAPTKTEGSVPDGTNDQATPPGARRYHVLATAQCILSAPWQYLDDKRVKSMISEASVDLYEGLQPKDALDAALGMLLVGVTNASLDCLSQAARVRPGELQCRDVNLRYGLKGAVVAAELAKVLEARRGKNPNNVTVGTVNVEPGGQAIVGNVEAGRRDKGTDDPSGGNSGQAKE